MAAAFMFLALIVLYVLMFGVVKFCENLIAKPHLVSLDQNPPLEDGPATTPKDSARSR